MKVLKKTDDYTVYQKRSGRYAVIGADNSPINGDEKVKILVAEGIVKQAVAAPEPEIVEEAVAEEAVVEEEVAASDSSTETAVPKKIIEAVTKESHFSAENLEAISKVIDEKIEALRTELSKVEEVEEVAETIVHNPEQVNMSEAPKGLVAFLNNRK